MRPSSEGRRLRLDVLLVETGLAESREKAQALVMAGRVRVNGEPAAKPGTAVRRSDAIEILPGPAHVGRGALKLEGALDAFGLDPAGRVAVDVGASTGGFTEVLLSRGALRVYAVDVGRGQLHEKLSADSRVVVVDGVNARHISVEVVPEPCSLATLDVSFISVRKVLGPLRGVLAAGADALVLVKPQFEVGKGQVGRGGIVKDHALHLRALRDVAHEAGRVLGYAIRGACASPITGSEGNREFFLHLGFQPETREAEQIGAELERAVFGSLPVQ
jgi:23S rRNA (cytidine1920-2'-O)/16S rRNA (cytidine1409-2'-O)-methyltransferase